MLPARASMPALEPLWRTLHAGHSTNAGLCRAAAWMASSRRTFGQTRSANRSQHQTSYTRGFPNPLLPGGKVLIASRTLSGMVPCRCFFYHAEKEEEDQVEKIPEKNRENPRNIGKVPKGTTRTDKSSLKPPRLAALEVSITSAHQGPKIGGDFQIAEAKSQANPATRAIFERGEIADHNRILLATQVDALRWLLGRFFCNII